MKKLTLCLLSFVLPLALTAAPVTADQAGRVARAWATHGKMLGAKFGKSIGRIHSHASSNGTTFYSVKMQEGGTLFLSSDTESAPVIGFTSDDSDFSTIDPKGPLWALLNGDVSSRGEAVKNAAAKRKSASFGSDRTRSKHMKRWSELLDETDSSAEALVKVPAIRQQSGVGDLRVAPLVKSKWSQKNVNNKACYNYYTPNGPTPANFATGSTGNAYCGCVATAMSQIMRYHCFPTASMDKITRTCTWEDSSKTKTDISLTTQGGTFDWANMTLVPSDASMTEANYQAIGKLTSDVGISVYMGYSASGSGAFSFDITYALLNVWGYKCAIHFDVRDTDQTVGATKRIQSWQKALFANFDAGYPVCMGIPGHAILADGYGFDGDYDYVHLNMGWSGLDDFWYNLPNVTEAGYSSFTNVNSITYNVFPSVDKSYAIVSGRVTDKSGNPQGDAKVEIWKGSALVAEVRSSSTGVWGAVVPAGTYTVIVTLSDGRTTGTLSNVVVQKPSTTQVVYNGLGRPVPYVDAVSEIGNSWGNDIVLSKPSFTALKNPPLVPYTQVMRTATGMTTVQYPSRFEDDLGNVVYSLLTETGRAYALGQDGTPAGDWVSGDGTPQLIKAPKPASGTYQVLVK